MKRRHITQTILIAVVFFGMRSLHIVQPTDNRLDQINLWRVDLGLLLFSFFAVNLVCHLIREHYRKEAISDWDKPYITTRSIPNDVIAIGDVQIVGRGHEVIKGHVVPFMDIVISRSCLGEIESDLLNGGYDIDDEQDYWHELEMRNAIADGDYEGWDNIPQVVPYAQVFPCTYPGCPHEAVYTNRCFLHG